MLSGTCEGIKILIFPHSGKIQGSKGHLASIVPVGIVSPVSQEKKNKALWGCSQCYSET